MSRQWRARSYLALFAATLLPATAVTVLDGPVAAAPKPAVSCPAEAADEPAAIRAAAACHGQVEVASARDEKLQVFANPNGSFMARVAALVQRVRGTGGRWVKPDPSLHRDTDGRLIPVATSLRISFSGGGSGPAATIGKGPAEVSLRWPTALPTPRIDGPRATYPEVFPGVDLVLIAQVEGFAQLLVVKDATAATNPALGAVRFTTTAKGLRLRQGAAGDVSAVDDSGATLFGSGTPAMWDSAKPTDRKSGPNLRSRLAGPGGPRAAMPVQLSGTDLVVRPDLGMLRDKATTFPVYIDPGLGKSAWTMINSRYSSQSYWSYDKQDCPDPYGSIQCAKVGYTTSPTSMIYRSLFAFGIGGVMHKHIQDAKLSMDTVYSYTNTDYGTQVRVTGGISSGTTWSNNSGSWGGAVATANSHAHDRVRRRTEWGVTSAVRMAAGGSSSTLTLGLRAVSESDENQWKKFDAGTALLTIIYNSYPNAPSDLTIAGQPCRTGTSRPYIRTLTPQLKGRLTDPDGTVRPLKGTFYWWKLSGGSRNGTDSVAQGSIVSGQYAMPSIPSGRLADGGIYVVQAIANDGIDNGQYSSTCEFQVDVTPPAAPSAVTSTDYPNDGQAHGGVGTPGNFLLKPPTSVPGDFSGYAYTLDPGINPASATQVTANATDHTATISITPVVDQAYNLRVWSRDQAGNYSSTPYVHSFTVRAGTGPDARWTFDDRTGGDDSQHGNTLTVNGGTWIAGRGSYGSALVLDGTSTYAATSGPVATRDPSTGLPVTVHSNQSFTVAATVRLDSTAGSGQRTVVAQDGTRTSPFLLSYSVTDKKWRFAVAATDVDAPTTAAVLSNSTAATGVWTRLLATYDGGTHALKLYVNGVLQTATASTTTFDATGPVTIGRSRSAGVAAGYFPGAIDDVRLYGRALLSTEHEFGNLQLPNPPIVTLPNGTHDYVGRTLPAVLSAGGDTSVTKIQYQLDATGTVTTVTLPTAGGQTTVNFSSASVNSPTLIVQGIDTAGNKSPAVYNTLEFAEAPALTGKVIDAVTGTGLAGITVQLSPGGLVSTTSSTGAYNFTGIAAGTYDVTAMVPGSGCAGKTATTEAVIDRAVAMDLNLAPQSDVYGYTCKTTPNTPFVSGTTKVALDAGFSDAIALPFSLPYYGRTYDTAWVSEDGVATFKDPNGNMPFRSVSLPDWASAPHAAVMPFWDDLITDSQTSVWTATIGSGATQRFVVEWRNVSKRSFGTRFSFEAQFSLNGDISFNYGGGTDDESKGGTAAVGIASPGGVNGLEYSFQDPILVPGTAVTFIYPEYPQALLYGSVSGNITRNGLPVRGAAVSFGQELVRSDGAGFYRFSDVESGTYGIYAYQGCDAGNEPDVLIEGDATQDLPLTTYFDDYGYSCSWQQEAWIPGQTVVPNGSADLSLPFPFPYYEGHWTFPYVGPGYMYEDNPVDGSAGGEVEFWPGANRIADGQSSTLTAVVGTAPNRQFVVEARNYKFEERPELRLSWEMIFGEDGSMKMIFKDPPDPTAVPYSEFVYLHPYDHDGITYDENGDGFPAGKAVVIHPPASGS